MKLNYRRTVLIGLAFMSILAFWQFYDQVMPILLENHFGKDTITTNAIMAIDNILALFLLPLFGTLSDKTKSKLGKRTPYILFGTIAASVLMCLLAWFAEGSAFLPFFIVLVLLLVAMSVYRSPAVAYMPDVTPKPLRSKANAVINLVGYIGGIVATVLMMFLSKSEKAADGTIISYQSFSPLILTIAGFMLLCVIVLVLSVKENRTIEEVGTEVAEYENSDTEITNTNRPGALPRPVRRSLIFLLVSVFLWYAAYNAVTTAFSRFCQVRWNVDVGTSSVCLTVATVAAIAAFLPLGFLSSHLGRKKTVLLGIILMAVSYILIFMVVPYGIWMYPLFGLVGIGWAAINVNSYPMVVEMGHQGDVGKFTGLYYAFSMAAQIVTPLLSAFFISKTELFGHSFGLDLGYDALCPYAVIFLAAAFLTTLFVFHGDSKPMKKTTLEALNDVLGD